MQDSRQNLEYVGLIFLVESKESECLLSGKELLKVIHTVDVGSLALVQVEEFIGVFQGHPRQAGLVLGRAHLVEHVVISLFRSLDKKMKTRGEKTKENA